MASANHHNWWANGSGSNNTSLTSPQSGRCDDLTQKIYKKAKSIGIFFDRDCLNPV